MPHSILLVDDETHVVTGLQRALHKAPYTFLSAGSADEALSLLRTHPVDVVISDQHMPGTLGTAFLSKVYLAFPDTIRILLTGQATREVVVQAVRDGAVSHVLTKPCSGAALQSVLQRLLPQKDLLTEGRAVLSSKPAEATELTTWTRTYSRIMQLRYPPEHEALPLQEALPVAAILAQLQARAAKAALMLSIRRRHIVSVTLNTLQESSVMIDLPGSGIHYSVGDRLLLLCAIPPQERYILEVWVDELYYHRVALRCSAPQVDSGTRAQVVYRST
ncbi:MAG: response regulator [Candidatus Tectimicrobiota bacterium]